MYNAFNAAAYGEFDVSAWPTPSGCAALSDLYRDDFKTEGCHSPAAPLQASS